MREIIIDTDTTVGYDFEKHSFFVTNKGTTTYRETNTEIKKVLDIVAPDNTVSLNDLYLLSTTYESLVSLSYTWEDTGSYIKTIQLNDYERYPLTLDAEKSKIYVMNSTTIFDLTLNEGRRDRLIQIQAFYRDTIGLLVSLPDLQVLYMLLVSFYNPTCYNVIEENTDTITGEYTIKYNNTLKLSNYRKTSPATYSCLLNPTEEYSYNPISEIKAIEGNAITLTTPVPSIIKPKTTINITNTAVQVDTDTYSSDGTYVVKEVKDNLIYTTENLPANFSVTLPTLNLVTYPTYITEISREKQTITLTNSATDFLIGDKVVVRNAQVSTSLETLSLDGFYTIIAIEDNVLKVDEVPITDYSSTEQTAYVYKPTPALTVTGIENNLVTVTESDFPSYLEADSPIVIFTQGTDETIMQYTSIVSLNQEQKQILVRDNLTDNVPRYGLLRQPIPYPYVLITVDESNKAEVLPTGEFMVDTKQQAINYLSLLNSIVLPTDDVVTEDTNNIGNFNTCGTEVRDYYIIDMVDTEIDRMELKGLYSKVYEDNSKIN